MGKITLLIGGARSGKSTLAQRMAGQHAGQVVVLATATADDDEMRARIAKHRQERPAGWVTLEIPHGVAAALAQAPVQADLIVLDCLTMLVTNATLLGVTDFDNVDEDAASARVEAEISGLLETLRSSTADWIIVTNEVGLGLVPPYPLGRIYRDLLGRANQQIAALADEVLWMVAGIAVPIHEFRDRGR